MRETANVAAVPRRAALAGILAAVLGVLAGGPEAAAKAATVNPVVRRLEAVEIGPGVEHRLVIVHPILAQSAAAKPEETVSLGGAASPDALAFGRIEKPAKPRAEAMRFAADPAALFVGDVVRAETADFAVSRDVVATPGQAVSVQLVRASREIDADPKFVEPATLGPVLPSALRYLLLAETPAAAFRDACEKWSAEVHADAGRRSPADLVRADMIAKRVSDYRKRFVGLSLKAPAAGREIVGCAVLLDGAFASIETYADGKLFASAWPRLLDAIAAEASVLEVRSGILADDVADPADPDRFLSEVKKRLLDVYAARLVETDVRDVGRGYELSMSGAAANALVVGEDRVVHFVLVTDPAHRVEKKPPETPNPGADARKMRPTEEEKRLIERRKGATPTPPPPTPPPTPK